MRPVHRILAILFLGSLLCGFAAQPSPETCVMECVLRKMDDAAANFHTTQADFVWDQYQKVVDETDTQKGTVYYRRSGKEIEMMAEIKEPDAKFVLYREGKLQVYQPKIEQVLVYPTSSHGDIESYLVLGFGGSGQELTKSFDVSYTGDETVAGIATGKLQLIPKSEKVRNNFFAKAILWIDLSRGISVQQQFFQIQGDYRLARYSGVRINAKIGNDVFQLKTTKKTQFVSPRG
ncbi:MAG TPA: outer membrane lipoprotein carrier protein LolA [Candidatus Acidoferrum sp.]|jgi:outer membrane lipoprotein-sorting protein|nr:outer membrane lipoprotein carrier protein LolA [Candidatus Acidoferrum sp.]